MRVLHVINSLILAGAEALTKELALECKRRGVDVSVAVLKKLDNAFEHELLGAGVPVIYLSSTGIYSPLHIVLLAQKISEYDVVQATLFPATLWTAMAVGGKKRIPRLVTSEQNTTNRRRNAFMRPLDRWLYARYQAIPCASRAIEESLLAWLPKTSARTRVIHNAIDLKRFEHGNAIARSELGIPESVPLIAFTARFEPQKDHVTLLQSVARLTGVHLLLAGDGPLRPKMEVVATSLGIRERVHFLGRRADVASLLRMADVYVQSSHFEGFGIAAVEAMASGLPVVASAVPGLSDVVGDAGLLVPPGNVDALTAALRRVLESKSLRSELRRKSLERAQQFSIQQCADAYLSLYSSLLGATKAAKN
jgi:glycosyltransferase involved in cell wall biosynthesis